MAIDTSIYNHLLRPPKSIAEYDAEAMQGQQNKLALQMNQAKMGEYQRGVEQENALAQAYRSSIGSDGAIDRAKLVTGLAQGGLGAKLPAIQKGFADQDAAALTAQKIKLETGLKQYEVIAQAMAGVKDQQGYDNARQEIAKILGPQSAANIPPTYDAGSLQQWGMRALSIKDQKEQEWKAIEQALKEREFGETVRNNKAQTAETARGHNMTAGAAAARLKFDKDQAIGTGPDASEAMIDAIGTGRMAPPSGYALRNPKILAMMERVGQKYPEYDATEYAGKTKAMRDFTTGKQGDSIRSFSVASDHLKQLDGLVDALNNGNTPLVNKYANIIATNTGSTAPTNFEAAKGIVAKEVLKSIVAGGGGVEERQELSHLLADAKTGPQLKGVIKTYLHLMEAQRDGLERQYENSTGRKDAKTRFDYSKDAGAATGHAGAEKPSLDDIFGKK